MQLVSAHITNFRSAEDSEPFAVGDVTCLVGKNEAGKSALLLALAALNPHPSTPAILDKERDYPRRQLTAYDATHGKEAAVAVTSVWQLTPEEKSQIDAAVGEGVLKSTRVSVLRRYGKKPEVIADIDFALSLESLYKRFALDAAERAVLKSATTTSALIETLAGLSSLTEKHTQLKAHLDKVGTVTSQVNTAILGFLPKFMYFSSYDRMEGAIQLEQTRQLIANGQIDQDENRGIRLFVEFLEYAGVSIDEITATNTYETFNAKLQAASNNITDQILEYWTQNPDLSVVVRVEPGLSGDRPPFNSGTVARARVYNSLHRVDTPFSERSAGFVWFFSFLVKFAQVKDEATPVILLLDEPGLTLHGKAQADLLRFFSDKLAPHHQIIYSTHSPFMVPANDLASVRIVEDKVETKNKRRLPIGTKVRDDVLTTDPDTLFPLQGALGYDITQSLFVGENTLLVEGPGDILYLQALSDALTRKGRTGLDKRWTVCPAGGIDKLHPFIALFAGNALNVAVLSDQAKGDKTKIEKLKRSEILKAGHFFTMADFVGREEGDIEDIFEAEIFAAILNGAYQLTGDHEFTPDKLSKADTTTSRQLKKAEAAFKVMPETIPMLDHFTPAAWLLRNGKILDAKSAAVTQTLDRAEKIFETYNALL